MNKKDRIIQKFERLKYIEDEVYPMDIFAQIKDTFDVDKKYNKSYNNKYNINVNEVCFKYEEKTYKIKSYNMQLDDNFYKQQDVVLKKGLKN